MCFQRPCVIILLGSKLSVMVHLGPTYPLIFSEAHRRLGQFGFLCYGALPGVLGYCAAVCAKSIAGVLDTEPFRVLRSLLELIRIQPSSLLWTDPSCKSVFS